MVISGLVAGVRYAYKVGILNGTVGRGTWCFTMPAVGTAEPMDQKDTKPLRLAMFGDMGQDLAYNDRVGSQYTIFEPECFVLAHHIY